jgi:hypothetical protein
VLFSGAVLPVTAMTAAGKGIAALMSDRWAFEALARSLHLADGVAGSPARQAIDQHGHALSGGTGLHVAALVALCAALALATRVALSRRAR